MAEGGSVSVVPPTRRVLRSGGVAVLLLCTVVAYGQSNSPLRLEKTIPLPGVKGRIDHMAFDAKNQRLYVSALGNNTVEVIDIKSGARVQTVGGMAEPQGVVYQPEKNRLWIANGEGGTVRILDAQTFQPVRTLNLGDDADNIRRDAATQRIFVGYGGGGIAVFDSDGNKVGDVKLSAHPESFQLEKNGSRMFVNVPISRKVVVIDKDKLASVATWTVGDAQSNYPMALNEADGRLFIVCRNPAVLLVMDTDSGGVVAKLPTVGDSDDVFYDEERKRLYVSGGEGSVVVYQRQDRDHYVKATQVETAKGARTSLFVPEIGRLFVAARQGGPNAAAIEVFEAKD